MAPRSVLRSLPGALTDPNTEATSYNEVLSKAISGKSLSSSEKAILSKGSGGSNSSSSQFNSPGGGIQLYSGNNGYQSPTNSLNNSSAYQGQVPTAAGGGASSYAYTPSSSGNPYSGGAGTGSLLGPSISESNNAASMAQRNAGNDSTYNQQVPQGGGGQSNTASINGSSYDPSMQNAAVNDPGYQYKNFPTLNLPDAPISTITPKDFSTQAGSMAAKAYAPSYAALDTGRGNVKSNYTLADKVVAGLYDNLAKGNDSKQAASTAQYAVASKAGAADAAATQATIGKGFQSAQSNEAATLKSLGITAAAPGALQATANAQAQQQGSAAQNSANQAAALKSQATNQSDFQANQGSADQSQGLADRSSLLNTRNTTLGQYDAQQQVVAGQQGQQALSVGQGLTSQDLSAQQTNANLKQQQYSSTVQNLMNQYNSGVANMQYQDQQNATQYDRAVAANSANYARGQQQWQNAFDTSGQQGNLGVDATNAASTATKTAWDVSPQNPSNYYRPQAVDPNSSPEAQVTQKYYPQYSQDPSGFNDKLDTIKSVFNTSNGPQKGDSPLAIKNAAQNAYRGTHPNATQNDLALIGEMALDFTNGVGTQSNSSSSP